MRSLLRFLSLLALVCLIGPAPADDPPRLELFLQIGHTNGITGVALSADGKLAVTGSYDYTAILWDTASGKKLHTLPAGWVTGVAVSRDGKLVLVGSQNKTASLWEAASGKKLQTFKGHANWVVGVAFSGDGKLVLTGGGDRATLWDAASARKS